MKRIACSLLAGLLWLPSCQAQTQCDTISPTSVTLPSGGGYSSDITVTVEAGNGSNGCGIYTPIVFVPQQPAGCVNACSAQLQIVSETGGGTLPNYTFVIQFYAAPNTSCLTDTSIFANDYGQTVSAVQPPGPSCTIPFPPANPVFNLGPAGTPSNPQGCACDPVSTGNGNYYYTHTDLSVQNYIPDLALTLQRSYNSEDDFGGSLGHNWTHNFNIWLGSATVNGIPAVAVKWGDGHNEIYFSQNGAYTPLAPATSVLVADSSTGNYILTRKDGVKFTFASNGLLSSIQNRNGQTITVSRDSNNNLLSVSDGQQELSFAYGSNLLLSSVTDLLGRKVLYAYDSNGDLISETDTTGNVTQYAYDSNKNLVSVTLPNGSVVQNTYGAYGVVASQTNADGYITTFAYSSPPGSWAKITDPLGNVTVHNYGAANASLIALASIVDPLGHTTSFTYDKNNDITSITDPSGNTSTYAYDSIGNLLTYVDPLGNTRTYTYNSFSKPLNIKAPLGDTTNLSYDSNGNLLTVSDPLGDTTALTYDGAGRLLTVTDPKGNSTSLGYGACSFCVSTITDAAGQETGFAYDAIGRLISTTDANKHTSSITYDALSRITSFVNALGAKTLFAYDSVGHPTSITDANAHATSYSYDLVGNLTLVTDAMGHSTSFTYDKNNNLSSFVNGNNHVTSYSYDAANRLIKATSPKKEITSYAYNANGTVASVTDGNGETTNLSYDRDNHLTGIGYSDGSTVAYSFDSNGNRLSMEDAHGTTSYAYDALNRILSIELPGGNNLQYAYDGVGNKASLQYPDGHVVSYEYDGDNRLAQIIVGASPRLAYGYDPAGNVITASYPNGVTEQFSYDAANRLTQIVDQNKGGVFRTFVYGLDAVGNRTNVSDNGVVTKYTYNAINELKASTTAKAKTTWDYSAVGNRTTQVTPSGTTTYTYDAAERMLTAGSMTFTYDKNGNRLTEADTSGTTMYSYDASNRLRSVVSPGATSRFSYDGDGNRVTQTVPSGTYNYVNDTNSPLAFLVSENGPDGAIDYDYGLGLLESSSPSFNYFYSSDSLGSVTDLTDASGVVQQIYSYDAWGNSLSETGGVGTKNKFRFTGQALDAVTGLYFMRARYYELSTGRFLSKDPFPGVYGSPITLHHYIYARNNPTNFVDPTGLQAENLEPGSSLLGPLWVPVGNGNYFDSLDPTGGYAGYGEWLNNNQQILQNNWLRDLFDQYYFNLAHSQPQVSPFDICPINAPYTGPSIGPPQQPTLPSPIDYWINRGYFNLSSPNSFLNDRY